MDGLATVVDPHHVDEQTRPDPGSKPPGDLLAVGGGSHQHGRRGRGFSQSRQHVDERGDQVLVDDVGLSDVNLGGTGRLQSVDQRRGGAGGADHNGGRLTQRTGGGDQFGADLLQRAFRVLNEHQYFSHGVYRSFVIGPEMQGTR